MKWDVVIVGPGRLGARAKPGPRGVQPPLLKATVTLQQLLDDDDPRPQGKTGIPAYWKWCDSSHECMVLLDSGYCKLEHIRPTQQFREQLNGQYWRTATQARRHPAQAPGPGGRASFLAAASAQYYSSYGAGIPVGPEPAIENAGIRAGEIIGRRAWLLNPETGLLHSIYMHKTVWHPGKILIGDDPEVAVYDYDSNLGVSGIHAFKIENPCGLYNLLQYVVSWRERFNAVHVLDVSASAHPLRHSKIFVTGTIAMWGKVIEHRNGYRAQYAAVESIDHNTDNDAPAIAERYGVSLTWATDTPTQESN